MVFLGGAGFFVPFDATTFFVGVVVLFDTMTFLVGVVIPFDATIFFVGVVVTTAGCLVDVANIFVGRVAAVGFLVGVDVTVSFLGVGLLLGSWLLLGSEAPSWE